MSISTDRFAERLKIIIAKIGSAAETGRLLGVSESTVRSWRNNNSDPQRKHLVELAKVSGVSLAWLASGEGEMEVMSEESKVDSSSSKDSKFNLADAIDAEFKPPKIINGLAASLTQLMIGEGLLPKGGNVSIKTFINIYNQVCDTSGSNKDMKKAIFEYMLNFHEEQLADFRIKLAKGNMPDELKTFEDLLKKQIQEKQEQLEALK